MEYPHQLSRGIRQALVGFLFAGLFALSLFCASCSNPGPSSSETSSPPSTLVTSSSISPTSSVTSTSAPSTTTPSLLSPTEKELARTARIQNSYAAYLTSQHVPDNDPRMAVLFALRARVQALSCLRALSSGNMEVADMAMLDVYRALNRGQAVAAGNVAEVLSGAHAVVAEVGAPSDRPEQARKLLEQFVEKLSPLVDEAVAALATTTTTGG